MVALLHFSAAPSLAKSVADMSDAEFVAFMAAQRDILTRAALERAVSWRESSP